MALWDICKGKGRVSTILPLLGYIERGHSVYYLTTLARYKNITEEDGIKIYYIHIPFFDIIDRPIFLLLLLPILNIFFAFRAVKVLRDIDVDVIYAHSASLAFAAKILSKKFNSKYVLRLYGVGNAYLKKFKPSSIIRRIALYFKADAYILTDDGTKADLLAKSCNVPDEKIHFLKNGIDKSRAHDSMDNDLIVQYAPNGERLIISVCRLSNTKGVDTTIKLFAELHKINPNTKLLIIGDGGERPFLYELVNSMGISRSVCFIGAVNQSEVFRYLKISDLFVAMNRESNLSNPVFEAMLSGLPVVALDSGNTSSLIADNVNGVLVKPECLDLLHIKISELLHNKVMLNDLGTNAQNYILSNFMSWSERVAYEVNLVVDLIKK